MYFAAAEGWCVFSTIAANVRNVVTAVMHRMVSPTDSDIKGTVIGIDHLSGLTDLSVRNLKNDGVETGSGKGIEIVTGDGRNGRYNQFTTQTLWLNEWSSPQGWSLGGKSLVRDHAALRADQVFWKQRRMMRFMSVQQHQPFLQHW